jgi:hypothetical protein
VEARKAELDASVACSTGTIDTPFVPPKLPASFLLQCSVNDWGDVPQVIRFFATVSVAESSASLQLFPLAPRASSVGVNSRVGPAITMATEPRGSQDGFFFTANDVSIPARALRTGLDLAIPRLGLVRFSDDRPFAPTFTNPRRQTRRPATSRAYSCLLGPKTASLRQPRQYALALSGSPKALADSRPGSRRPTIP